MNGAAEDCPGALGSVDTQDSQAMSNFSPNWGTPEHSQKREMSQIGLDKNQKKGFLTKVKQITGLLNWTSKL